MAVSGVNNNLWSAASRTECDPAVQSCVQDDGSCFITGECENGANVSQGIWNTLFMIPLVLKGSSSGGGDNVSQIPSMLRAIDRLEGNARMNDLDRLAELYLKEGKTAEGAAKFRYLANNYEAGGSYGLAAKSLELAAMLYGAAGDVSGAGDTKVRLGRLVLTAVKEPSIWGDMKDGMPDRLLRVDDDPMNFPLSEPLRVLMNVIDDAMRTRQPEVKDVKEQIVYYFMREPYDHKCLPDIPALYSGELAFLHEYVAARLNDEVERVAGVTRSAELYVDAAAKLKASGHILRANYYNWRAEQIFFKLKDHGGLFDAVLSDWQMWNAAGNEAEAAKTVVRGWHYFCESVLDSFVLSALTREMPELDKYDALNQEGIAGRIADRIRDGFADIHEVLKWMEKGNMAVSGDKFIEAVGVTAVQLDAERTDLGFRADKLALSLLGGNSDGRPSVVRDMPMIDMKGVAELKLPESLEKAAERVRQAREKIDVRTKGGKL